MGVAMLTGFDRELVWAALALVAVLAGGDR